MKKNIVGYKFCSSCGNKKTPECNFTFDPNTGAQYWTLKCNTPKCVGNCADHGGCEFNTGFFTVLFHPSRPSICKKCGRKAYN